MKTINTIILSLAALAATACCNHSNNETTVAPPTPDSAQTSNATDCSIDLNNIEAQMLNNFKGGDGSVLMKMFQDGDNRVMLATIPAGASVGFHSHDNSLEVVYVLNGVATILYDSVEYTYTAGQAHYCAKGHSHSIANTTDSDLVTYNVVATQ